jgi:hypothetical protein
VPLGALLASQAGTRRRRTLHSSARTRPASSVSIFAATKAEWSARTVDASRLRLALLREPLATPAEARAAAEAAAAATVAPLLQLKRAANKADKLARFARAMELYERALAAAEVAHAAAQPRDSLIIAALLHELSSTRFRSSQVNPSRPAAAARAEFTQRLLHLLHARALASRHALFAHGRGDSISGGERVPASPCADGRRVFLHPCA